MTIDEAIKLIIEDIKNEPNFTPLKFSEAKQLGIEGLKRIAYIRIHGVAFADEILPGETEE